MQGCRVATHTKGRIAMSEPRYSLSEIDTMRTALQGWCGADPQFPADVEEMLRTYMLNGTPAAEVVTHCEAKAQEGSRLRALP